MAIDSNISIEDLLKKIDNKLEQKEEIKNIIEYCDQCIVIHPNDQKIKNKLEFLHDLAGSEEYISQENTTLNERIDLEEEFAKLKKLESQEEVIDAYKKLEKKYPGHKGVEEGIAKYTQQKNSMSRGNISQTFREISQMKGPWGEPDYEGQKKRLLELEEKFPFHEGVKAGLKTLEEGKKNNFRDD